MVDSIMSLIYGFGVLSDPWNIFYMFLGVTLGVLIGVLPGLGGANGVAILLPLTFSMTPVSAIIMLSSIYWGALFGGAITSILFNIPGEPWSVATTFDGYPMAQQGKAGQALTAAFTSSFIGGTVAVILITFMAPIIADFALEFGPAEFFGVYMLTFCSFVGMGKESPFKVLAAMMLGFALAAVGIDIVTGTLGIDALGDYMEILPFFDLRFTQNFGVSLGMFSATSMEMRWMLVAVTALIALVVFIWMLREKSFGEIFGLSLILGGALGNIVDRYQYGYVIDYADFHIGEFRPFLIFNVADAAITIGVVIILARALFMREKPPETQSGPEATENS